MNILIYFDGENKLDSRGNALWNIEKCLGSACFNSLIEENFKIKIILPENSLSNYYLWGKAPNSRVFKGTTVDRTKLDFFMSNVEISAIADEELINCFDYAVCIDEIYALDLEGKIDAKNFDNLKKVILEKVGDFHPDLVISYPLNLNFLRKIFEDKMVLVTEWGIFSRNPLPQSIYFDPIGSVKMSFLNSFAENIKKYPITDKENQDVEQFKKKITNLLDKTLDISDRVQPYIKKYRKLILCPLVGVFYSEGMCAFADDHAIIRHVMKHVPPDIGVIFTFHPGPKTVSISEICYYREKYHNFIYIEELIGSMMPSVALFPYVDAVINSASMTGTMAMLWDLPIIPLYGHYNDWMKDCDSINEVEAVLSNPIVNKNNRIYWYFTHFAIFENRFEDGHFYKKYFEKKLDSFNKKGITFDFYEQNDDFVNISKYVIDTINNNINVTKKENKKSVYLFGKIRIGSIVRQNKEISIIFLGIRILRFSFLQKKLFFCGIPIMRWKNE